jgi:diacylglycerol kinase (ATP)
MLILVNPMAAGGTASKKWDKIKNMFTIGNNSFRIYMVDGKTNFHDIMKDELTNGETDFIAAGGDGTVNYLLNELISVVTSKNFKNIRLGAIGIGSSNDFHKPFSNDQTLFGIPTKIGFDSAKLRDIGCISYISEKKECKKYFIINSSIGITADANYLFNNPDKILNKLKKVNTGLAILYSALKTIVKYKNIEIKIETSNEKQSTYSLANLGIVKNPHFSGNFRYQSPICYNNGKFDIHLCQNMSKIDILKLFVALQSGRVRNSEKFISWQADSLTISSSKEFAVEYDGEVIRTNSIKYNILKEYIKVCQ